MAIIRGTDGDDELAMTGPGDMLFGRAGNDLLLATFASGVLRGNMGDDRFVAEGTGGHRMYGADGNDAFDLSGSSDNVLHGETMHAEELHA